jgi:hypothetical protein
MDVVTERNGNSIRADVTWTWLEPSLFHLFSGNFAGVLDFLILQDKHNIHTLSSQARKDPQKLPFLPISKVRTNTILHFPAMYWILYIYWIVVVLLMTSRL